MEYVKGFWRDESGVVESSLVMIPLLVLFLISAQLIVAVNMRNVDLALAQGRASAVAIGAPESEADDFVSFPSPDSRRDLRLIVTHLSRKIPDLLAGLSFLLPLHVGSTEVSGFAVVEESRP
jgi:hypothetical protein